MTRIVVTTAAILLTMACSSQQEPAKTALDALEKAATTARPDVERYAPARLAEMDAAVAGVKSSYDAENYAAVVSSAQPAIATLTGAAEAAAARKAQLSTEWAAFTGMPAMIGQIKAKVDEVGAMRRLPRDMDRAKLESAKSSLESATSMWDDASSAHDDGNLVVAVSKARDAKPIVDALMTTLGLS